MTHYKLLRTIRMRKKKQYLCQLIPSSPYINTICFSMQNSMIGNNFFLSMIVISKKIKYQGFLVAQPKKLDFCLLQNIRHIGIFGHFI
jgi:hypothetical protein